MMLRSICKQQVRTCYSARSRRCIMSVTVITDTEYATLWYYPDEKIVHHQFHKFIHSKEFRQVLERGLEIFKQNGAQKWLSDDRMNSALTTADTEWGQQDWFPRVFQA